jgi:molybdopterin molybdotransferase
MMETPCTVTEASQRILGLRGPVGKERCRLGEAAGRILRQEVVADRDFPPFNRVMLDGLALRHADLVAGCREFTILGAVPAGASPAKLPEKSGAALEVATGAVLPEGADCILPCEEYEERGSVAVLARDPGIKRGLAIHPQGSDHRAGDVLLRPGQRLGPVEIGIAAACGCAQVEVSAPIRVVVIATGDELAAVEANPREGQIRQTNAIALAAALQMAGHAAVKTSALGDERGSLREGLAAALSGHDVVILTGGVSRGRRDLVPPVLTDLGARLILHGVAQRPGKPMGVWQMPEGTVVFGLPGNPVSALVCFRRYVLPALGPWSGGAPEPGSRRILRGAFTRPPGLTLFLPVLEAGDGSLKPSPVANSGDFAGLAGTRGFVEIDESFAEGTAVPYFSWCPS